MQQETATATATAMPQQAPPLQDYNVEVPTKSKTGARFVFTVADLITGSVKDQNPLWELGGVVRDGALTLKYQNGYIRRCEITALRQYMDSDLANFVHESQRQHKDSIYIITEPDPVTGELKKRTVGYQDDGKPDGLLRTPFYPIDEIGPLVGQSDGIVEMPCTTAEEARRAQHFLFPQWPSIRNGALPMPEKTAQLRGHFMKRLAEAQAVGSAFFADVAKAAIRSCDLFKSWAERLIQAQNARYDEAKAKGWAWSYGGDAEMVFAQIGIARRDNLVQEQADKMDKLTDAMTLQAQNQSKLIDLQLAQAQGTTPKAAEDLSPPAKAQEPEPLPDPPKHDPQALADAMLPKCLAMTKSGAQCKNDALEDGFCNREDHNAATEAAKADEETE